MNIARWLEPTLYLKSRLILGAVLALFLPNKSSAQTAAEKALRYCGDAEGGAPFVEADPANPERVRGFDVEVAELLASGLHRSPRFVQVAFASLDASVQRGDCDLALSGVEETPARRERSLVSVPYFAFREALTVRASDAGRLRSFEDLRGHKVGTLGATLAWELVHRAEQELGAVLVTYEDDVHPYSDLVEGRIDGVVLDHVIAQRAVSRTAGLVTERTQLGGGNYVILVGHGQDLLQQHVDALLRAAMRDGTLRRIYERWGVWDDGQAELFQRVMRGADRDAPRAPSRSQLALTVAYLPALLKAALITLLLSCLSMTLAVVLGMAIAVGRVYGGRLSRTLLLGYVEVVRGTPVLLQLFLLYYGLSFLRLPAFAAAALGLGLNYAAYESEIYRGALEAVTAGQLEAARTLGLTEWQILRLVRGPQALRFAVAPMTNDFVALLKDSSLVSVITVIELTKQTSIFAANLGSWALPGALCATLYLGLSLPLSRLARSLELRWKGVAK